MRVSIDSISVNGLVTGNCGEYRFQAKVYDEPSYCGINRGRVSKLNIREGSYSMDLVNYDRGWDIKPKGKLVHVFNTIVDAIEDL